MGADKAWLRLGRQTMIERVVAVLRVITNEVAIIGSPDQYSRLGLPVFPDQNVGVGPLEAIRVALSNSSADRVILTACDMPFVSPELFVHLLNRSSDYDAVVPVGPDSLLEPLCAVYSQAALAPVTRLIEEGKRKMSDLFERVETRTVAYEEISGLRGSEIFFLNVNTQEDYSKALSLIKESRDI